MNVLIFLGLIVVGLIFTSIQSAAEYRRKNRERLIREYNESLNREIDVRAMTNLKNYAIITSEINPLYIDDDTWNDLDLDVIFEQMNNTNSSVGREYLYYLLHNPTDDVKRIEEIHRLAQEFNEQEEERLRIQEHFISLGYAGIADAYSYIYNILSLERQGNVRHYLCSILLFASFFILFFVHTNIGLLMVLCAVGYNVISYFKVKSRIEGYFNCMKCIVRMVAAAKQIKGLSIDFIEEYNQSLDENLNGTIKITKNFYLITSGSSYAGSLAEVLLDYIRILFHVDLIRFNQLVSIVQEHQQEILGIYETLGFLESCIAVSAYRNKLPYWSVPHFSMESSSYEVCEAYHPLLTEPVANSIKTDGCILLTGSNASGKSTFLRAIALNALLSQTIATSTSKSYTGTFYRIISSMSHKDSITQGDSYYMVEIKALKRILDETNAPSHPILCFLDEVLRGTNTVERIAASTQILRSFHKNSVHCFAATHDIELTQLLQQDYSNYHFEESFVENDVRYNYLLKEGPATTRNAIKLLEQTGYEPSLIKDAVWMTEEFEHNGVWRLYKED